ncbi:MAG: hypothetical protein EXS67_05205 [Candidatus Margulisbacteria bacterium]|nr:hypothetical protein [Candidatus Margulisiibacteriota bacterium]
MPRKARVTTEGGWYHVFNRSNGRKTLYHSEYLQSYFVSLLEQISEKYEIQIHSYCVMKNHYHILIHTPKNTLSNAMWYLGKNFAREVNIHMNADGPVFKSRFHSLVVETEKNLLNLSRYIHLNPVSAQMSTTPEEYTWSSHSNFLDPENAPPFLHTSKILEYFISKDEYKQYVELGVDANTKAFFGRKRIPGTFKID